MRSAMLTMLVPLEMEWMLVPALTSFLCLFWFCLNVNVINKSRSHLAGNWDVLVDNWMGNSTSTLISSRTRFISSLLTKLGRGPTNVRQENLAHVLLNTILR